MFAKNISATLLVTLFFAATGFSEMPISIDRLAWLSGCWAIDNSERGSGEQWSKPAGGTMFGTSRLVSDEKTVAYEFLRIVETDDGSLVFIASPSGQPTHAFALSSIDEHEVVFEDPEHDFPQRIIYRLTETDRLLGRIEGESDGRSGAVDFPMTRTTCEEHEPDT